MTDDDQLRADRDRLAESLFALRGRLVVSARDERLPEPVRHLLVCLLHGHGVDRAIEEGFQRQGRVGQHQDAEGRGEADQAGGGNRPQAGREEAAQEVTIHYDPATRWLREAGVTGPIDEVVVKWQEPVVFDDEQYETND